MLKSILCIFEGSPDEFNALNAALQIGKSEEAKIRVIHVSSDPEVSSIIDLGILIADPDIIAHIEKENKKRLIKAENYVYSFAARHRIPLNSAETLIPNTSVRFLHFTGRTDDIIAREGRISDLIIIGRESSPAYDLITPALFNTGRPVLFMPQVPEQNLSDWRVRTAMLAWNGSQQSANALRNAIPLLSQAEKLHIVIAHDDGEQMKFKDKEEWLRYLHAHGIATNIISISCGQSSTGEALLDKARELKADLLVMGAYGHNMLREIVLGGVTEYMLGKSDIPLLLSH